MQHLEQFKKLQFDRGAPRWKEILWIVMSGLVFSSWIPGSAWRVWLLRLFGAKIGEGGIIKPYVKIKFPWKLEIGSFVWIGESVWIDNLDWVRIGNSVCISQGAFLETGSHDYKRDDFKLITKPIVVEDGVWVCAFAKISPGVIARRNSVIGFGSVLIKDTEEKFIYSGNPAEKVKERKQTADENPSY